MKLLEKQLKLAKHPFLARILFKTFLFKMLLRNRIWNKKVFWKMDLRTSKKSRQTCASLFSIQKASLKVLTLTIYDWGFCTLHYIFKVLMLLIGSSKESTGKMRGKCLQNMNGWCKCAFNFTFCIPGVNLTKLFFYRNGEFFCF